MTLVLEAQPLEKQCLIPGKPSWQCFSGSGRAQEVKLPSRWYDKDWQETEIVFQYQWCDVLSVCTLIYLHESPWFSSIDKYRSAHKDVCADVCVYLYTQTSPSMNKLINQSTSTHSSLGTCLDHSDLSVGIKANSRTASCYLRL